MTTEFVKHDLYNMIVGDEIGQGASRKVYEHKLNPDLVVKVEENAKSFNNISEYTIWQKVLWMPIAKWFAQ